MFERKDEKNLSDEERFDQLWEETDEVLVENPNAGMVYQKLKYELFPASQAKRLTLNIFNKWLGYVAAFIAIGGCVWFYKRKTEKTLVQIVTTIGENKIINLADGSKIVLLQNSQISYAKLSDRVVKLHGNALFTVVHDQSRPFLVSAGQLLVKDIGTVFKITMQESNNILHKTKVSVTQGSVSVINKKAARKEVILMEGEEGVYDRYDEVVVHKTGIVNGVELSASALQEETIKQIKLNFIVENKTASEVFKLIEHQTAFRFSYRPSAISDKILLSLNYNHQTLEKILKDLALTNNLRFLVYKHNISVSINDPSTSNVIQIKQ